MKNIELLSFAIADELASRAASAWLDEITWWRASLPAVEPGLPARRIERSHPRTTLENFKAAQTFRVFFRVAGCRPLRQAGMPDATTPALFNCRECR